MIWGILLYYLWIVVVLFLLYLLWKCAYKDRSFERKHTYPMWMYIIGVISSIIPAVNLIIGCVLIFYIGAEIADRDLYIKHWLFKEI